jgi:hypothetical protein
MGTALGAVWMVTVVEDSAEVAKMAAESPSYRGRRMEDAGK